MPEAPQDACHRYAKLIESLLPAGGPAFDALEEDERTLQVERGVILPLTLAGADPERIACVMNRLTWAESSQMRVVDAAGHARPAYPGLLVHAWRRALPSLPPALAGWPALGAWRKRLADAVAPGRPTTDEGAVNLGDSAATLAECAWASAASGDAEAMDRVFPRIFSQQRRSGAFFPAVPSANPETLWYHELVLLHAVGTRAAGDPAAREAALRNAEYHLSETQPDHATNEPWGLLAFILNPGTHTLADQVLHTVRVQHPAGAQGVTAILLADVLVSLRELGRRSG